MRILVVAPGATVSTHDVFAGVLAGLRHAGADVITYSMHGRIREADRTLWTAWRLKKKQEPNFPKPTFIDVCYQSCMGLYEKGYRFNPDVVLFVSGVLIVPDVFKLIRTRHMVGVLLTESPYLMEQEGRIATLADIAWTNERSALQELQKSQPRTYYAPHAWLPDRHGPAAVPEDVPAHDVVFVGTGFRERIELLEQVDWTGIDLGLYGSWRGLKAGSPLLPFVRDHEISNEKAVDLYRKAKIGLNLYRTTMDSADRTIAHAESLNPRAYELAACGVFSLSTHRAEVTEKFGALVPTFSTGHELRVQLRRWLADDAQRSAIAAQLPACVAEDSWLVRGRQLLDQLRDVRSRAA